LANDWLFDQPLSEHQSLIAPLHAFFCHQTAHSNHSTSHHPSLVVEVGQNYVNPFVLLPQEVLDGHLYRIECDECCSCSWRVACLDGGCLHSFSPLYEDDRKTFIYYIALNFLLHMVFALREVNLGHFRDLQKRKGVTYLF
jgi:hypothetical protein